jgi:spermidine/putrescine transport system substrate-binding protein
LRPSVLRARGYGEGFKKTLWEAAKMETKRDIERFIDKIKYGSITRREVMQTFASVGIASVLVPTGRLRGALADDSQVTCFGWSGYEAPEMHKEYAAKNGGEPNFSIWGDEEEAESKMRAGFHPDVVMPCSYKVQKWNDLGFLRPIDTSRLSHWGEIIETLYNVPDVVIGDKRMWVPAWWGLTSVSFRTDIAPEYVPADKHTWGILWDEKYAGRLSMIDSLIDGVMVAAIYSGAKDPFNMTPEEVAKCKELMIQQRPLLRFYTNDNTGWQQALASGELVAADSWNDTILFLSQQGIPSMFMNPKEGPMTWTCGIAMTSWVKPELEQKAYDLIDNFLSVDTGVYWVQNFGMGHSNKNVYTQITADELTQRGLTPGDIDAYIAAGHFQATIKNEPELQAMYEEVKAGI